MSIKKKVAVLIDQLQNGDVNERWEAAEALTELDEKAIEAYSALKNAIKNDEDYGVRFRANKAYRRIKSGLAKEKKIILQPSLM
jgi:HEAT repeat protein